LQQTRRKSDGPEWMMYLICLFLSQPILDYNKNTICSTCDKEIYRGTAFKRCMQCFKESESAKTDEEEKLLQLED
jgi:predicted amidophosphoribosyltransferase